MLEGKDARATSPKRMSVFCLDLCLGWSGDTQPEAIPAEGFPGQV